MNGTSSRWLQRDLWRRLVLPGLGLVLIGAVLSYHGAHYLIDRVFDRWLLDSAHSLAQQVRLVDGRLQVRLEQQAMDMLTYDASDRIYFSVVHAGMTVIGSEGLPVQGSHVQAYEPGESAMYGVYRGDAVRVAWVTAGTSGELATVRVGVAETLLKRKKAVQDLILLFSPLSLLLLAAIFLAVRGVRRTVTPLALMAKRWNAQANTSLQEISTEDVPRELLPFAHALNGMLARVRAILDREQRLSATAAHQLRTPLTALQLGLARAQETGDLESMRSVLKDMSNITQRTARLVQQLLLLGRLDPEIALSTSFADVDLVQLAQEVGELYQEVAAEKNVRLELIAEAHGGADQVFVRAQADLLAEALGNLVDNAVRYAPMGGHVLITVTDEPPAITVQDDGAGVPPEDRGRIFERFTRGSQSQGVGSGLGLTIVREIMELHRAEVCLASAVGDGALFRITFPAPAR